MDDSKGTYILLLNTTYTVQRLAAFDVHVLHIVRLHAGHYDSIAERYDEMYDFMYGPLAELAIQHLQIKSTDKVLDVGAGTGGVAHEIWMRASQPHLFYTII